MIGFIGPAEAVPLLHNLSKTTLSAPSEVVPFQNMNDHLCGGDIQE
jgi:hypothetical protein